MEDQTMVIISAGATLSTNWIARRSEEKRHSSGLIMNAAIENYKESAALARERMQHSRVALARLDVFIILCQS